MHAKILQIPGFGMRYGEVEPRICQTKPDCRRVVIRPLPQSRPVQFEEVLQVAGEDLVVEVFEYRSRSGLTYTSRSSEVTWLPTYGNGAATLVRGLTVVPRGLTLHRIYHIITFRDFFLGAKAEYTVVASEVPAFLSTEWKMEAACPICARAIAERTPPHCRQGRLIGWRAETAIAVPAFDERLKRLAWLPSGEGRFFNHVISPPSSAVIRGQWALVRGPVTVTSPDHPSEDLRLDDDTWLLYHPWPERGWVD